MARGTEVYRGVALTDQSRICNSWSQPDGHRLPPELCKKIAGLNNQTAAWDKKLVAPKFYKGKYPDQ